MKNKIIAVVIALLAVATIYLSVQVYHTQQAVVMLTETVGTILENTETQGEVDQMQTELIGELLKRVGLM